MTLLRPDRNTPFAPNTRPPKAVRFDLPDEDLESDWFQERVDALVSELPEPPPRPILPPKTGLQQFWEEFKITNWWAVLLFKGMFSHSNQSSQE